eukprot:ANDGO_06347.mRNA.1 hypothetical protein
MRCCCFWALVWTIVAVWGASMIVLAADPLQYAAHAIAVSSAFSKLFTPYYGSPSLGSTVLAGPGDSVLCSKDAFEYENPSWQMLRSSVGSLYSNSNASYIGSWDPFQDCYAAVPSWNATEFDSRLAMNATGPLSSCLSYTTGACSSVSPRFSDVSLPSTLKAALLDFANATAFEIEAIRLFGDIGHLASKREGLFLNQTAEYRQEGMEQIRLRERALMDDARANLLHLVTMMGSSHLVPPPFVSSSMTSRVLASCDASYCSAATSLLSSVQSSFQNVSLLHSVTQTVLGASSSSPSWTLEQLKTVRAVPSAVLGNVSGVFASLASLHLQLGSSRSAADVQVLTDVFESTFLLFGSVVTTVSRSFAADSLISEALALENNCGIGGSAAACSYISELTTTRSLQSVATWNSTLHALSGLLPAATSPGNVSQIQACLNGLLSDSARILQTVATSLTSPGGAAASVLESSSQWSMRPLALCRATLSVEAKTLIRFRNFNCKTASSIQSCPAEATLHPQSETEVLKTVSSLVYPTVVQDSGVSGRALWFSNPYAPSSVSLLQTSKNALRKVSLRDSNPCWSPDNLCPLGYCCVSAGPVGDEGVCQPVGIGYYTTDMDDVPGMSDCVGGSGLDVTGTLLCTNAPPNAQYTSDTAGSSDCPWECVPGYSRSGNSCEDVPLGYYSDPSGNLVACPISPSEPYPLWSWSMARNASFPCLRQWAYQAVLNVSDPELAAVVSLSAENATLSFAVRMAAGLPSGNSTLAGVPGIWHLILFSDPSILQGTLYLSVLCGSNAAASARSNHFSIGFRASHISIMKAGGRISVLVDQEYVLQWNLASQYLPCGERSFAHFGGSFGGGSMPFYGMLTDVSVRSSGLPIPASLGAESMSPRACCAALKGSWCDADCHETRGSAVSFWHAPACPAGFSRSPSLRCVPLEGSLVVASLQSVTIESPHLYAHSDNYYTGSSGKIYPRRIFFYSPTGAALVPQSCTATLTFVNGRSCMDLVSGGSLQDAIVSSTDFFFSLRVQFPSDVQISRVGLFNFPDATSAVKSIRVLGSSSFLTGDSKNHLSAVLTVPLGTPDVAGSHPVLSDAWWVTAGTLRSAYLMRVPCNLGSFLHLDPLRSRCICVDATVPYYESCREPLRLETTPNSPGPYAFPSPISVTVTNPETSAWEISPVVSFRWNDSTVAAYSSPTTAPTVGFWNLRLDVSQGTVTGRPVSVPYIFFGALQVTVGQQVGVAADSYPLNAVCSCTPACSTVPEFTYSANGSSSAPVLGSALVATEGFAVFNVSFSCTKQYYTSAASVWTIVRVQPQVKPVFSSIVGSSSYFDVFTANFSSATPNVVFMYSVGSDPFVQMNGSSVRIECNKTVGDSSFQFRVRGMREGFIPSAILSFGVGIFCSPPKPVVSLGTLPFPLGNFVSIEKGFPDALQDTDTYYYFHGPTVSVFDIYSQPIKPLAVGAYNISCYNKRVVLDTALYSSVATVLFDVLNPCLAPSFSPTSAFHVGFVDVRLSSACSLLYYALDDATSFQQMNESAILGFNEAIAPLNTTRIIRAFSGQANWVNSSVVTKSYVLAPQAAVPSSNVSSGEFYKRATVRMTCSAGYLMLFQNGSRVSTDNKNASEIVLVITAGGLTNVTAYCRKDAWYDSTLLMLFLQIVSFRYPQAPLLSTGPLSIVHDLTPLSFTCLEASCSVYYSLNASQPTTLFVAPFFVSPGVATIRALTVAPEFDVPESSSSWSFPVLRYIRTSDFTLSPSNLTAFWGSLEVNVTTSLPPPFLHSTFRRRPVSWCRFCHRRCFFVPLRK